LAAVLDENEVYLYGVHYPITKPVTPQLIGPFGARIVQGDPGPSDQVLASEWVINDFRGGLGVFEMDEKSQLDRYWDGTALGLFRKQLTLPLEAIATGNGGVDTDPVVYSMLEYSGAVYAAFDSYVRKWNGTTSAWDDERTLADAPTGAVVFGGKMFWFTGDEYDYFDGSNWHRAGVPAMYGVVFDEKLVTIDNTGLMRWTIDGETWFEGAKLPLPSGSYTDLAVYWNIAGEPAIYVGTKKGLWVVDFFSDKAYPTVLEHTPSTFGGKIHGFKDGYLYVSNGLPVYRFSSNTVTAVGLDRDDGLNPDLRGDITFLTHSPNWLIAVLDATSATPNTGDWVYPGSFTGSDVVNKAVGYSSVLAWTGSGWHSLFRSSQLNTGSRCAMFSTALGDNRLWFGANGQAYYIKVPEGVYNPLDDITATYSPNAYATTGWYDAGFARIPKLALSVAAEGQNLSNARYINIYYGVDGAESWSLLGTMTSDQPSEFWFNGGEGLEFKKIRFMFDLATDDKTITPVLRMASLRFEKIPNAVWGWTFEVDCTQAYKGRSPVELLANLRANSQTRYKGETARRRGVFTFRDGTDSAQTHLVRISNMAGREWTGSTEQGIYNITVVEA
jgi:hypothetical protein